MTSMPMVLDMGSFRLSLFGLVLALVWCHSLGQFTGIKYYPEPNSDDHGQSVGRKPTSCKCGWTNKDSGRIVGGQVTKPNEYPHMATFVMDQGYTKFPFCGCTIITPNFLITAAHCTEDFSSFPTNLLVYVGAHYTTPGLQSKSHRSHYIKRIHQHESYDSRRVYNDIALLETKTTIEYTAEVGPACLPTGTENIRHGEWVKVTGWGTTSWQGSASSVLKKVNLKVVDLKQCAMYYSPGNINTNSPTQFCTYKPNEDSCQGDSGGPLIWHDSQTNRYTLVGLVSYGKECGSENPAVNTLVYSFMPWIERIISTGGVKRHCHKLG